MTRHERQAAVDDGTEQDGKLTIQQKVVRGALAAADATGLAGAHGAVARGGGGEEGGGGGPQTRGKHACDASRAWSEGKQQQ